MPYHDHRQLLIFGIFDVTWSGYDLLLYTLFWGWQVHYDWAYWRLAIGYLPFFYYIGIPLTVLLVPFYTAEAFLYPFISSYVSSTFWNFQLSLYYLWNYMFGLELLTAHN